MERNYLLVQASLNPNITRYVKMKISKNIFFVMSQGSLYQKNRFLGQKVCTTCLKTDTRVNTVATLSGFQEFFLQPIIKDRSNIKVALEHTT